ncbi:MAG: hypothetical protein MUF29_09655 [Chitinophagaceae bacterium]|jgi:hypothetical protein|nr:hypothetical protein [Chitinophagaceae bacterium]
MYKFLPLAASLFFSLSALAQTPKYVGKEGKTDIRIEDLKYGFTKSAADQANGFPATTYVIFRLNPNQGGNFPPQNPIYLSRIIKLTGIPKGYDPKGYGGSVIRNVSKDFLAYAVKTYGIVPEHYVASFETGYELEKLLQSLSGEIEYNKSAKLGKLWVMDDNFRFDYKSSAYSFSYQPPQN